MAVARTSKPSPTELESCVLAIVGRLGPCTAYAIRRFLSVSESSYWSASAGAIYPLMDKLVRAGWVKVAEKPFGERRKRLYKLTARGRRLLVRWLSPPIPQSAAAHTFDPIRTRVFFLDLVGPDDRQSFVDDAISQTLDVLERHRRDYAEHVTEADQWELLGRRGAMRELTARLEWLRELRDTLAEDGW